ncbi:unnamed protein product, partial [Rotaria sp. Silwood2]
MIRRARCEIFGFDQAVDSQDYRDASDRKKASEALPVTIRNEIEAIEKALKEFSKPENLVRSTRLAKQEEVNQKKIQQLEEMTKKIELDAQRLETERQEAARQEAARQEALRQEAARVKSMRQEAMQQEAARLETIRQEAARLEALRQDAARQEQANREYWFNMTNTRMQELTDRENDFREYVGKREAAIERKHREFERTQREQSRAR